MKNLPIKTIIFSLVGFFALLQTEAKAQKQFANPVSFKLKNGMTLVIAEGHNSSQVYSGFSFDGHPEVDVQKLGVMNLLGSFYHVSSDKAEFSARFLSMFAALKSPELDQSAFDQFKSQLSEALHTQDHPYGELVTQNVLENLELQDLKTFYKTYINNTGACLTIAGDISPAEAKALVEKALEENGTPVTMLETETLNNQI